MYKRELHVYKLRYVRDILNQARNLNRPSLTKENKKQKTKQNKTKTFKQTTNNNKQKQKERKRTTHHQQQQQQQQQRQQSPKRYIDDMFSLWNKSIEDINEFTATTGNLPTCIIVNHKFKVLGLGISFFSLFFSSQTPMSNLFLTEQEVLN